MSSKKEDRNIAAFLYPNKHYYFIFFRRDAPDVAALVVRREAAPYVAAA